MPHKFSRGYSLSVVAPFFAALIALAALTSLGQMPGAAQQSARHTVVSLQHDTFVSVPVRQLSARNPGGERESAIRSEKNKPRAIALDQNPPLFLPAVYYPLTVKPPRAVAIADVNRDGIPDIVVVGGSNWNCTGENTDAVNVLLGNGDGTFKPAVLYCTYYGADAVVIADVNGDDKPDLVVGDAGGVSLLLGNGDGTYQTPVHIDFGSSALSLAVADLNHDGKPDLIVGGGGVSVLLGNGDGTFQKAVTYGSGGPPYSSEVISVAIADMNRDGNPDIVCANDNFYQDGTVAVLLGNGDGTFRAATTYDSGGTNLSSMAVADLNGDGSPDVVATDWVVGGVCWGTVNVLLGNGDGTLQTATSYDTNACVTGSVVVADLDRNGVPDVVSGNTWCQGSDIGCLSVLLGNGDGTFQKPMIYGLTETGSVFVAVGDLNGDMEPDVVETNHFNGTVGVLLHVGDIPTTTVETSSPNPSTFGQAVTLTATVSSSSETPTGTVVFYDGSTALGSAALENGSGAISVWLSVGSHSITAVYQGSLTFASSTSSPLIQLVTTASTTTSIASSHNPVALNMRVIYTATVTSQYGGWASGSVTFLDGGVAVATVTLNYKNQAAYSASYTTRGTHVMTAAYAGDSNNASSASPPLVERVTGFLSQTAVSTSGSPSQLGQPVTFTAKVTSTKGTIPDGEVVTFYDGKKVLGSVALANGLAAYTTSTLSAKKHTIKATYPGDSVFNPSSGHVVQVVEK